MTLRAAPFFRTCLLTIALLAFTADIALADTVTATPPLQVVPATTGSRNVQQRMRACNAAADAKKLPAASRETFIKSCMTPHRSHSASRPGGQTKADP